MTLFRIRRYGTTDWLELKLQPGFDTEQPDVEDLEEEISDRVESALEIDGLHVQRLSNEGDWEDLE